jgi:threonine dehydrogenase-like Zn-dependent dehydrogenase
VGQLKALRWHGPYDVRVEEVEEPSLKTEGDAIVRTTTAAICGTDLHIYRGELAVVPGDTVGHEFMGVVEKVGRGVKRFSEGDRVVVSAIVADGRCWFCRHQLYTQCENINIFGMGPVYGESLGGAFAESVRVPNADTVLIKAPDRIPDDRLVMVGDGLATGYDAVVNAGVKPGDVVAIVGSGPVGLVSGMCAEVFGASEVVVVGRSWERLDAARSLGFRTVNAREADPADEVRSLTDGRGADVVIEAVGRSSDSLMNAINIARRKGTVSVVGFHLHDYTIPMGQLWLLEKKLVFSLGNAIKNGETLIRLIERGRLDSSRIVTHRLPLEEAPRGFELLESKKAVKVLLQMGGKR